MYALNAQDAQTAENEPERQTRTLSPCRALALLFTEALKRRKCFLQHKLHNAVVPPPGGAARDEEDISKGAHEWRRRVLGAPFG